MQAILLFSQEVNSTYEAGVEGFIRCLKRSKATVAESQGRDGFQRFFALVFGPRTHECFEFLAQPSAREALDVLWRNLDCRGEFPEFAWFPTYALYESAYIALFDVGLPEPAVPLLESAHDKSHPAQEIALENTYFYDVLGLKSDPAKSVPDYLITQLEYLAALRFTRENTHDAANAASLARAKSEFLQRHLLNWAPQAITILNRNGCSRIPGVDGNAPAVSEETIPRLKQDVPGLYLSCRSSGCLVMIWSSSPPLRSSPQ